MTSDTPRTDDKFIELDDYYGKTWYVVPVEFAQMLERELTAANERIAELERGEFICRKCGLRKDAAFEKGDF